MFTPGAGLLPVTLVVVNPIQRPMKMIAIHRTSEIGTLIMNQLTKHDKVAYVRFASGYMDFKDVKEFMAELKHLLDAKEPPAPKAKTGAKS